MKKKDKKFLSLCNCDLHNQICHSFEFKTACRLKRKGYIRKIDKNNIMVDDGNFVIWLSKKGLKKVKKIQKKIDLKIKKH